MPKQIDAKVTKLKINTDMEKLENVLLWLYKVWGFFLVELSNKNASALIVLKRLHRWICVQIIMVYKQSFSHMLHLML